MELESCRDRSRENEKPSKFRVQSKSWFLTYPRLDISKEAALEALMLKLSGKPIKGAVVCRELHKDGTPHIHAYVLLENLFNCQNAHFWDINGHHGNYQKARDITAVSAYIKKDGDFIEFGTIDWKEKLDAKKEHRRALGKKMLDPATTLKDMLEADPALALDADRVQKALAACKQAFIQPCETEDVKGIWILGKAGVGKSHLVRDLEKSLYIKSQNKWWDGYVGEKAVLIDDFDKQGACLSHYMKIWTDKWGCKGEIKGAMLPLGFERFYVTSNYSPEEIFSPGEDTDLELVAAIKRRFQFYHLQKDNYEEIKQKISTKLNIIS